jgi:hypothetical protein
MSKLNKYQQQLSNAIETTRADLLSELKSAQAVRMTALSTRDLAAHDKWSAYKEMGRNEQILAVSSRIEGMAARTQLLAGNLTLFANDSQTDSEEAQAAMAEAAAAIKNASSAMELLTEAVHAEAAVTKSRNDGDLVNEDAMAANNAVEKAMTAVDDLQNQSLKCSIIAATPLAGSVAQSFSVLGDQAGNLVADTTQARDAARQEVAATTAQRNQTWKRFYQTIEPFERPLQMKLGLTKSFAEIDKLANFGLTVSPSNQQTSEASSSVDQKGLVAGLLAKVVLPVETTDFYHAPVFYAVKEVDAATFNFALNNTHTEPSSQQPAQPAGGKGVWKQLMAQLAKEDSLVKQAVKDTQTVIELIKKSKNLTDESIADSQKKAAEKSKPDQAAVDQLTAEGNKWKEAFKALAKTQAAFEATSTKLDVAQRATLAADNAEKALTAAQASKSADAFEAATVALEKAGLVAAQSLEFVQQNAENAKNAADVASQEVKQAESAPSPASTTTASSTPPVSEAVQKMQQTGKEVYQLAQAIYATAQKENQSEIAAVTNLYQAQLLVDNTGVPLSFGTSYCIFMKQELKKGVPDSPLAYLPRFSMPSQPILATYSMQNLLKPTMLRLQCGKSPGLADPLLVAFTLPAPPPKGVNYRMVVIPSHLWQTDQENEAYLIERANPSDYVELDFKRLSTPPPTTNPPTTRQDIILSQFEADIKSLLPTEDHKAALEKAKAQITDLFTKQLSTKDLEKTALVYYSSVFSKLKYAYATFGYYSDMSGDVITLNQDSYQIGVLAWQNNPDGPYVGSLIGKSDSIGTPPPYFYGSGPVDATSTPTTTPAA